MRFVPELELREIVDRGLAGHEPASPPKKAEAPAPHASTPVSQAWNELLLKQNCGEIDLKIRPARHRRGPRRSKKLATNALEDDTEHAVPPSQPASGWRVR